MADVISHDRLFKELITNFFFEFLELFLPKVADYVDGESITFLDKELFTDVTSGAVHEADIIVRCQFSGDERFFLIHVESEARSTPVFPRRMFQYFSRLFEKYGFDVYPIVLFTFDSPMRAEPHEFTMRFPDLEVLKFQYRAIQLNRLDWRNYIRQANPVAAALMSKMKIATKDRPFVKLECLRVLATLRLNPAKARLISGFVHTYLKLTADENAVFLREIEALTPEERRPMINITNEWIEKGREEGLERGRDEGREEGAIREARGLLLRLGQKRLGTPSKLVTTEIEAINETAQLEALCERVLDAETWQELLSGG